MFLLRNAYLSVVLIVPVTAAYASVAASSDIKRVYAARWPTAAHCLSIRLSARVDSENVPLSSLHTDTGAIIVTSQHHVVLV